MAGRKALIEELLKVMSADLASVQPDVKGPLCPLCLRPFVVGDPKSDLRPTAEHIVQESLGGTLEFPTLTCSRCNSGGGRRFQGHLKKAMRALDFMDGKGSMPTVIHNDVGLVVANLDWNMGAPVQIKVVGEKGSNVDAVEALPSLFREDGKIKLTFKFDFIQQPYLLGVLRVAYLAAFKNFGYSYAFSEGAAQVRQVMDSGELPCPVVMEAFPDADPIRTVLIHAVDPSAVLVLFRLENLTTRWLAVLLPGPAGCSWQVLGNAVANAERLMLQVRFEKSEAVVNIRFSKEPVEKLRDLSIPSISPAVMPVS
jgi:hypothetical protein